MWWWLCRLVLSSRCQGNGMALGVYFTQSMMWPDQAMCGLVKQLWNNPVGRSSHLYRCVRPSVRTHTFHTGEIIGDERRNKGEGTRMWIMISHLDLGGGIISGMQGSQRRQQRHNRLLYRWIETHIIKRKPTRGGAADNWGDNLITQRLPFFSFLYFSLSFISWLTVSPILQSQRQLFQHKKRGNGHCRYCRSRPLKDVINSKMPSPFIQRSNKFQWTFLCKNRCSGCCCFQFSLLLGWARFCLIVKKRESNFLGFVSVIRCRLSGSSPTR